MKLVHWLLMGWWCNLLHSIQRGRYTECNSPPINGQCTKLPITVSLYI